MFCALNESSASESDEGDSEVYTREIQEEEAYSLYKIALSHMVKEKNNEACEKLKEVLELPFLTNIPVKDEEAEDEKSPLSPPLKLKYLVYKNLATIAISDKNYKSAIESYIEALEIDPTDVRVWYEMGKASLHIINYNLSRLAFEEAFKRNPHHWPCLDNLITITYTLNDYATCLLYVSRGLEKEPNYIKALAFKDKIFEEDPSLKQFCEGYFSNCSQEIYTATYDRKEADTFINEALDLREKKKSLIVKTVLPTIKLSPINEYTWKAMGESLIATYDYMSSSETFISFSSKITLTHYLTSDGKVKDLTSGVTDSVAVPEGGPLLIPSPKSPGQLSKDQSGLLQISTSVVSDHLSHQVVGDYSFRLELGDMQNYDTYNSKSFVANDCVMPSPDSVFYADASLGNKRIPKRKLSDLSEKSGKRRSMRVRNPAPTRRQQDNINYQDLLHEFLPSCFFYAADDLDEESRMSQNANSGDHTYGQIPENSGKSEEPPDDAVDITISEMQDVQSFILSHQNNGGILDLLYKYIFKLGSRSNCLWPRSLMDVFSGAFLRLRRHITMPNLFSREAEDDFIKDTGFAVLTFSEFKVDQWYLSTGHASSSSASSFSPKLPYAVSSFQIGPDSIGKNFHADMEFLMQLTVRRDVLDELWLDFVVRTLWLKAKFHSVEGEVDLAVCCLDRLVDVLQKEDQGSLNAFVANSSFSNHVTMETVQQQLELLQRCQSLEEVQRLFDRGAYQAVVDLLIVTFHPTHSKAKISMDGNVLERHAQLILLQDSLLKLKKHEECVQWTEVAFNEALQQLMNAQTSAKNDWSDTIAHLLSGLESCIKSNNSLLSKLEIPKLSRFSQNLIALICISMESYDISSDSALAVLPWIVLYRLILYGELSQSTTINIKNNDSSDVNNTSLQSKNTSKAENLPSETNGNSMPASIKLLLIAHECLGRRTYCCASNGMFLQYCVDILLNVLQSSTLSSCSYREDLEHGLEQCFYCLYNHPSKRTKAKHLQEHNSQQIPLTWKCAIQIYNYFKPDSLPEYDSFRTSTISAELENLFKRISSLVPSEQDPSHYIDPYVAYIEGGTDTCPTFPPDAPPQNSQVKDLYYLLGDFYFKNKEFGKAVRYYLLDISINPKRQDSWAGMALSRSSQLDQKLNSYEVRNEGTIYRKSASALRCFEHALLLDPYTTPLWIEYGSLAYVLHSHASRQLKQGSYFDGPRDLLKNKKHEMLLLAERCFREANKSVDDDGTDPEEAWLHHFMLGKIAQKLKKDPEIFLDHYQKSLMYLHEDEARYPSKIQYHNPPELSVDALEVYYRIHASCLKILTKHENTGMPQQQLKPIIDCIKAIQNSPFKNFQEKLKCETASINEDEVDDAEIIIPDLNIQRKISSDHNYSNKKFEEVSNVRYIRNGANAKSGRENLVYSLVKVVVSEILDKVSDSFPEVSQKQDIINTNADSLLLFEATCPVTNVKCETRKDVETVNKSVSDLKENMTTSKEKMSLENFNDDVKFVMDTMLNKLQRKEIDSVAVVNDNEIVLLGEDNEDKDMKKNSDDPFESVLTVFDEMLYCIQQNKEYPYFYKSTLESTRQTKPSNKEIIEVTVKDSQTRKRSGSLSESCDKHSVMSSSDLVIDIPDISSQKLMTSGESNSSNDTSKTYQGLKSNRHKTKIGQPKSNQNTGDSQKNISSDRSKTPSDKTLKRSYASIATNSASSDSSKSRLPAKGDYEESKIIIDELIHACLDALRECLRRFIQHYKSLYRMAFYYYYSKKSKNVQWAREILLAATPCTPGYPSMPGLFAERKNTNFFNGIWRSPSNEIDRPGSFGAHMFRSIRLLIDVLSLQTDYNMLLNITQQLYRTPDFGKKYMRDGERAILARDAYKHCITILREQMNGLLQEEPPPEESRLTCCLLEIYRTYQSLTKFGIYPDDTNELLEEAYTMYKLGEVDPSPSVLQQAISFCQRQLGKSHQTVMKPDVTVYRGGAN